jgi:glyoxylase-like metal-dependent hydrolase (beta-lactamase superfamily II)
MKVKSVIIVTMWFIFINTPMYTQANLPEIEVTKLSPNLYKFHHGVNNWLILIGPDGILLSDSAPEIYAEEMKTKIEKLSKEKVNFIINTHWHHDHTGGNLLFGKGATIIAHQSVRDHLLEMSEFSVFLRIEDLFQRGGDQCDSLA